MSEDTIFHEVTEELRRDQLHKSWRRFGPYVFGAAALVVLVVAGNEGWSWYQNGNSSRSSDQLYQALDLEAAGDLAGAQKVLDAMTTQGSGQYPVLARFKQAGLLAKQNAKDQALAAYDALATAQSDPRLKGLALLLGANILADKGDVGGVKSRIEGLLAPTDPLHSSARETLGLAQYKAGDLNGARDSFMAVPNDPTAPQETVGRMRLYVAQLVAQGATPPAGAAGADPASQGNPPPGSPAAAANQAPSGVVSSQPATPDAALQLALPPASAPAQPVAPALSTGAGQPVPDAGTAAPAADPTTTPAAGTQPTPSTGTTGK